MNKQRNQSTTGRITQGAAIAAVYVALTMIVAPIAFGPVQFRISEALCVLPYFLPSAVPGVTIGCFLANLLCGAAPLDVVFGSIATLIGAVGSYYLGKKNKWLVCLPPILSNTIIVPWVLRYAYGSTDLIPYADADGRNRRDPGYRSAGESSASGTGAESQSGIYTVKLQHFHISEQLV